MHNNKIHDNIPAEMRAFEIRSQVAVKNSQLECCYLFFIIAWLCLSTVNLFNKLPCRI